MRKGLILITTVAMALIAGALGESVRAARTVPVQTMTVESVDYVRLNDVLRALDGEKRIETILGMGRIRVTGTELTLWAGSRLIKGPVDTWVMAHPVLHRRGVLWVPAELVERVLAQITEESLLLYRHALFVNMAPGRVDSILVQGLGDNTDVSVFGTFPLPPVVEPGSRQFAVFLEGCVAEEVGVRMVPDTLTVRVRALERRGGALILVDLPPEHSGYAWREQSDTRLRLLTGTGIPGQIALTPHRAAPRDRVNRIVLDPGHGAGDLGVRLGGGIREKWLTLDLARVVADTLLAAGYEVYMTRNEDRSLSPEERAALANETDADILLSFQIETYQSSRVPDVQVAVHRPNDDGRTAKVIGGFRFVPWSQAQSKHLEDSRALANWLLETAPRGEVIAPQPTSMPLRVMEGVDMPAAEVLVSRAVTDPTVWSWWRESFAAGVAEGIRGYEGRREE